MNKRIRELAKEAAREMNESGTYSDHKFQEKFAELLVRECMSVIKADPQDGETINCIINLANIKLEKHFGVEK